MKAIEVSGLKQSIDNYVRVSRAPVLGICLGFQLLAEFSEEGNLAGLGYIPGKVRRLNKALLPVPHTGWNSVEQKSTHPLFKGIKNGRDFYFVHSYEMRVNQPEQILAATDYGGEVICGVGFENIVGVQFHPEKSQKNGLQLLENFCRWDGT